MSQHAVHVMTVTVMYQSYFFKFDPAAEHTKHAHSQSVKNSLCRALQSTQAQASSCHSKYCCRLTSTLHIMTLHVAIAKQLYHRPWDCHASHKARVFSGTNLSSASVPGLTSAPLAWANACPVTHGIHLYPIFFAKLNQVTQESLHRDPRFPAMCKITYRIQLSTSLLQNTTSGGSCQLRICGAVPWCRAPMWHACTVDAAQISVPWGHPQGGHPRDGGEGGGAHAAARQGGRRPAEG